MSTILVTGASGMIGKIVVASLLSKKHKVIGTDSKPSDLEGVDPNFIFTQADITNKAALQQMFAQNGIDFLVHLANTVDNDLGAFISDKEMKQSKVTDKYLYDMAVKAGCTSILIISTTQVYGIQKGRDPIRETCPEKGVSNYTNMKLDSEKAPSNINYGGAAPSYTRTVKLAAKLAADDEVTLKVESGVKSYAGVNPSAPYGEILTVEKKTALKAPVLSVKAGKVDRDTELTITVEEGATIIYTTDGTAPSETNGKKAKEKAELTLIANTTVQAIAVKVGKPRRLSSTRLRLSSRRAQRSSSR